MDDLLLDELGRSLVRLETLGPLLDDLVFPRQVATGENAGVAPNAPSSRPPVSVPMVDLKTDAQQVVCGWAGCLVDDARDQVGQAPEDRSLAVQAAWLREHLSVLEVMPWADLAAEEVIAHVRLISDVVDPPAARDAPEPLTVGTVREIVSWGRLLGARVSERSVRRWCQDGDIPCELAPDGSMLVLLEDVLVRARKTSGDQQYPPFGRVS
ncbi:hypothetical protein EAH68_12750 [Corynebacterium hylobatis]|uniref:Uncharacterized protein n=2 Tax=Corynebacterium hylobatis TaxID=1859290 RepID=A0A430HW41_9CORY|nr:hypothetical protein EAH68_12750 [Corynebacterium hylobatis]